MNSKVRRWWKFLAWVGLIGYNSSHCTEASAEMISTYLPYYQRSTEYSVLCKGQQRTNNKEQTDDQYWTSETTRETILYGVDSERGMARVRIMVAQHTSRAHTMRLEPK